VFVPVGVELRVTVGVGDTVFVAVGVELCVTVGVGDTVFVPVGVELCVAVRVGETVFVPVGVELRVTVGVGDTVFVPVGVELCVALGEAVEVWVIVGVAVAQAPPPRIVLALMLAFTEKSAALLLVSMAGKLRSAAMLLALEMEPTLVPSAQPALLLMPTRSICVPPASWRAMPRPVLPMFAMDASGETALAAP
jgi:hypothetical protein